MRAFEEETTRQLDVADYDLVDDFSQLEEKHGMLRTLRGVQPSEEAFGADRNTLLIFNEELGETEVKTFSDFRDAVRVYFELERTKAPETDIVLVAADDAQSVRFGFQNYFSDATEFVYLVEQACQKLARQSPAFKI